MTNDPAAGDTCGNLGTEGMAAEEGPRSVAVPYRQCFIPRANPGAGLPLA